MAAPPAETSSSAARAHLALTTNWWVTLRDKKPIRFALAKAARRQWLPALQRRLDQNRQDRKGCDTWELLASLLRINPATLFRWRAGKTAKNSPSLGLQDIESLASMLGVSVTTLVPEPWCQLAWAVESLCRGDVTSEEARAYSIYCHSLAARRWKENGPDNDELDRLAIKAVVVGKAYQREREAERAVRKVAVRLQPVLVPLWQ